MTTDLTEYVQASEDGAVHVVDFYGESMRVVTRCGLHLFWPNFTDQPGEPYVCLNCLRKATR